GRDRAGRDLVARRDGSAGHHALARNGRAAGNVLRRHHHVVVRVQADGGAGNDLVHLILLTALLRSLDTGRVDIDRIERRGRGDEQAIATLAAEGHIGDDLRHLDAAQQCAVRRIALDAVSAGPDVAIYIYPEAVRDAARVDVAEHAAVGQPAA